MKTRQSRGSEAVGDSRLAQDGVGCWARLDGDRNGEPFSGDGAFPYFVAAFALTDELAAVILKNAL